MGRISKAIKLKLQELRIDDIFKEGILKYKELLSNEDSKNEELENNLEKNMSDNSDLDIANNFEDNKELEDSKKKYRREEQQIEDDYEQNSMKI